MKNGQFDSFTLLRIVFFVISGLFCVAGCSVIWHSAGDLVAILGGSVLLFFGIDLMRKVVP